MRPNSLFVGRLRRASFSVFAISALAASVVAGCVPAPLPEDEAYTPGTTLAACVPDNDGIITQEELPFVPGARARIRVAEGPVAVDVTGRDEDGVRVWDFSRPAPETEPVAFIGPSTPTDEWFLDAFAERAASAIDLLAPLDPGGSTIGPLVIEDGSIGLLGAASSEPNPDEGRTLIIYDAPAPLYAFPLALGTRTQATVRATNATLVGLPVALDDAYDVEVTDIGTVILPDLVLENTLRVTVRLERTLVVGDIRQVTHIFVHECLGEVARVISEGVPLSQSLGDEFETASQVWRLSL